MFSLRSNSIALRQAECWGQFLANAVHETNAAKARMQRASVRALRDALPLPEISTREHCNQGGGWSDFSLRRS